VAEGKESQIRKADSVSAGALALLGLYLVVRASNLPFGSLGQPGPGFFPLSLSVLLVVLASVLSIRSRFGIADNSIARFGSHASHVLLAGAAMVLYVAGLEQFGFPLLTSALLLFLLRGLGRVSWWASATLAATGTAIAFFLFRWLGAQLPLGIFFM
jgi:putative tricarboxylic transport membrane protein